MKEVASPCCRKVVLLVGEEVLLEEVVEQEEVDSWRKAEEVAAVANSQTCEKRTKPMGPLEGGEVGVGRKCCPLAGK